MKYHGLFLALACVASLVSASYPGEEARDAQIVSSRSSAKASSSKFSLEDAKLAIESARQKCLPSALPSLFSAREVKELRKEMQEQASLVDDSDGDNRDGSPHDLLFLTQLEFATLNMLEMRTYFHHRNKANCASFNDLHSCGVSKDESCMSRPLQVIGCKNMDCLVVNSEDSGNYRHGTCVKKETDGNSSTADVESVDGSAQAEEQRNDRVGDGGGDDGGDDSADQVFTDEELKMIFTEDPDPSLRVSTDAPPLNPPDEVLYTTDGDTYKFYFNEGFEGLWEVTIDEDRNMSTRICKHIGEDCREPLNDICYADRLLVSGEPSQIALDDPILVPIQNYLTTRLPQLDAKVWDAPDVADHLKAMMEDQIFSIEEVKYVQAVEASTTMYNMIVVLTSDTGAKHTRRIRISLDPGDDRSAAEYNVLEHEIINLSDPNYSEPLPIEDFGTISLGDTADKPGDILELEVDVLVNGYEEVDESSSNDSSVDASNSNDSSIDGSSSNDSSVDASSDSSADGAHLMHRREVPARKEHHPIHRGSRHPMYDMLFDDSEDEVLLQTDVESEAAYPVPTNFDISAHFYDLPASHSQWKQCAFSARNQGSCGSCWAFASARSFSERACIQSRGSIRTWFSPEQLNQCAQEWEFFGPGSRKACAGGWARESSKYYYKHGAVASATYPYECANMPCADKGWAPGDNCDQREEPRKACRIRGQSIRGSDFYHKSAFDSPILMKGRDPDEYLTNFKSKSQIQWEVFNHGPLYIAYGWGKGGHALTVHGWGHTNDGKFFWLIMNSWGRSNAYEGRIKVVPEDGDKLMHWPEKKLKFDLTYAMSPMLFSGAHNEYDVQVVSGNRIGRQITVRLKYTAPGGHSDYDFIKISAWGSSARLWQTNGLPNTSGFVNVRIPAAYVDQFVAVDFIIKHSSDYGASTDRIMRKKYRVTASSLVEVKVTDNGWGNVRPFQQECHDIQRSLHCGTGNGSNCANVCKYCKETVLNFLDDHNWNKGQYRKIFKKAYDKMDRKTKLHITERPGLMQRTFWKKTYAAQDICQRADCC